MTPSFSSLLTIVFFIILTACGKENSDKNQVIKTAPQLEEQPSEGNYRAILRPINNQLSGFLPTGTAEITISEDNVKVQTLLDDDAKVTHIQKIQKGTRCPDQSDDLNNDGLIDMDEAYKASGEALIPLDDDLNEADLGSDIYPAGSGFTYTKNATLSRLENDVRTRTGENLNLGGRVILIHGAARGTKVPSTISLREGLFPQASIPVACGVLVRGGFNR